MINAAFSQDGQWPPWEPALASAFPRWPTAGFDGHLGSVHASADKRSTCALAPAWFFPRWSRWPNPPPASAVGSGYKTDVPICQEQDRYTLLLAGDPPRGVAAWPPCFFLCDKMQQQNDLRCENKRATRGPLAPRVALLLRCSDIQGQAVTEPIREHSSCNDRYPTIRLGANCLMLQDFLSWVMPNNLPTHEALNGPWKMI
jgi:hypothetical protein